MSLLSRENNPLATQKPPRQTALFPAITPNNNRSMDSTSSTRRGWLFNSTSPFAGRTFKKMAVLARKSTGSPTGNATFTVRNSSDTVLATLATFNVAIDLGSTYKWLYAEFGAQQIPIGGRILFEYSSGDASNRIVQGRNTSFGSSLHQDTDYSGSYTQSSSATPCMVIWA